MLPGFALVRWAVVQSFSLVGSGLAALLAAERAISRYAGYRSSAARDVARTSIGCQAMHGSAFESQ